MTNSIDEELLTLDSRDRPDPRNRVTIRDVSEGNRVPIGGMRLNLTTPEVPGYHLHTFNDVGNRIQEALDAGYVFVDKTGFKLGAGPELGHTDLGSKVSCIVGTDEKGNPIRAYTMAQKQEWYDADQDAMLAPSRENLAAIRGGNLMSGEGDSSHTYIPHGAVNKVE